MKKIAKIMTGVLLAGAGASTAAYAEDGQPTQAAQAIGAHHVGLNVGYDSQAAGQGVSGGVVPTIVADYGNFHGGLGFSMHNEHSSRADTDVQRYFVTAFFGTDIAKFGNGSLTAGVKGDGTFLGGDTTDADDHVGYDLAGYVGMDYSISDHWEMNGKLYAVNWGRTAGQADEHHLQVLGGGNIGMTYKF